MPAPSPHFDAFAALIVQIAPIDVEVSMLTPETTLAGDLMLDSISLVSLMALSEERFGISLAEHAESVAELRTVGDALDLMGRLTAMAEAQA